MFSVRWIREHSAAFDTGLARRGVEPYAAQVLDFDEQRRAIQTRLQNLQKDRNWKSKEIGAAKARGEDVTALVAEVAMLKDGVRSLEQGEKSLAIKLDALLAGLPNLPDADVPDGADESANVEIRRWGEPAHVNGGARQHFEIGEALGLMDFERAAKLSGSRFVVLSGALARLERALAAFMLDMHTGEFGLRRDGAAAAGARCRRFRHRQPAQVRGGPVPHDRRLLADPDRRDASHQPRRRRNPRGGRAPAPLHRLHTLLPRRGRRCGQGHQRHAPPASVLQGRAGERDPAGGVGGRARAHDRLRRGGLEAPRPRLPGRRAEHGRHGLLGAQDLRHRGSGCRGRGATAKSRAAPIAATSRPGA